jgi:hypothetical protein
MAIPPVSADSLQSKILRHTAHETPTSSVLCEWREEPELPPRPPHCPPRRPPCRPLERGELKEEVGVVEKKGR